MSTSVNKVILFGLIIAVAIIISLPFLFFIYLQSQYDIILDTFNFGQLNKHFQSVNDDIIMHSGHGFIAPNDELAVRFNFINGYSDPVEVATTIFKQTGDQHTNHLLGDYFVAGNKTDTQAYTFHVSSEGENDLSFVITLRNSTTHQFIQNLTTSNISLNVESVNNRLQEQANTITLSTLVVSGVIGGTTVYTLIRTRKTSEKHTLELQKQNRLLGEQNQNLKEQNDFIQKQATEQNRPWIGQIGNIESIGIVNEKNEIKSLDEWSKLSQTEKDIFNSKKMEWRITLKNYGNMPAVKVLVRWYTARDNTIARKELKSTEYGNPFVIMPNSEHPVILLLSLDVSLDILNPTIKTFTCVEIKYKSSNSDEDRIFGLIYERNATGFTILETWDEKSK